MTDDLSATTLEPHLEGRAFRAYPAMASTAADAHAWARAGAPDGAVVVADYQASAWRRGGVPWKTQPAGGLCFSVVLRPVLPPEREGWLYVAATAGIVDALAAGDDVVWSDVVWPDEVRHRDSLVAALAVEAECGPVAIEWIVLNVFLTDATPPRGPLLARLLARIDERVSQPDQTILAAYRLRCRTLDRDVVARLAPLGPASPRIVGRAVDVDAQGALLVETATGRRVAVRPQDLGVLDDAT